MAPNRSRIVQGSCWACKKRRVKCDLTKPACRRCSVDGTPCDYNARLIRWSKKPITSIPNMQQVVSRPTGYSDSTITYEKRALDYFHGRVWPLLSTSAKPCSPPTPVAMQHRVVLLATCLLADSHRMLQDGKGSPEGLNNTRLQCITAVRAGVDGCCTADDGPLLTLLFAVVFLYMTDGFMECTTRSVSTASHHAGVLAILDRLGGMETTLKTGPEYLQMLLSEFASADLTTSILKSQRPSFQPTVWDVIDEGSVWWGRDPEGRYSLASVFKEMCSISFYADSIRSGSETLSMDRVRYFETALQPVYVPLSLQDLDGQEVKPGSPIDGNVEALHAFTLIRGFQHAALIYLYRTVCGLPALHRLVQQHVQSCLDAIFEIKRPSHVLNCVIFPLFVAGAHAETGKQRTAVLNMVKVIYDDMHFASVESVSSAFEGIWRSDLRNMSWDDVFSHLNPHALVL